jgi:DNA-binding HxlR family transcriptional regulator
VKARRPLRVQGPARQPVEATVDRFLLEAAVDVLSCKWVPAVICELQTGPTRHGDLAQTIGLDSKQLARALHRLNDAGMIERDVDVDQSPPQVRYRLTPDGRALLIPLDALARCMGSNAHPPGVNGSGKRLTANGATANGDAREGAAGAPGAGSRTVRRSSVRQRT